MSTSLSEIFANKFAININSFSNKIQFLINIDESVYNKIRYTYMENSSSDLSNISNSFTASEFLLIFGSVLKLTNIINNKSCTYRIKVEEKIDDKVYLVNKEITELFNIYEFDFVDYSNKDDDLNDLNKIK